jgi:hypothetical protein
MDYRLIKENFDKATAELEEAKYGPTPFAEGDRVKFLHGSLSSDKNSAKGTVMAYEPAGHERKGSDGVSRPAYIVTVQWDEGYQPLASGGKPRTNIGTHYDDELSIAPATD